MNEEAVEEIVVGAMNPETFDVLDYLRDLPVAHDTVDVYVDVEIAKQVGALLEKRDEELAARRAGRGRETLALDDADDDTQFDDEINALVAELERTKLTFELQTVAPALQDAIRKSYLAKRDRNATPEEIVEYEEVMHSDILSRAIAGVVTGSGIRDTHEWDGDRLRKLATSLYEPQRDKLLTALANIVYAGNIIDQATTVDFS